ncbi:hypothetical protein [Sulfurimonas sp.]
MMTKLFLLLLALFLSACGGYMQQEQTPQSRIQINIIQKQVERLNSSDKKRIYRSIKNEIRLHKEKGDEATLAGHNYNAVNAYELVNFYEGYHAIPARKISSLRKNAKIKSRYHYKQALKYLKKNKKRALHELNLVMMNNPHYKDAKQLLEKIKRDRTIVKFINSLKIDLEIKVSNCRGSLKDLQAINKSLKELSKYEYSNETIDKANRVLKKYNTSLLKDAIKSYKKNKLKVAKKKFSAILSIYHNDPKATIFLEKIRFKQSKKENLAQARQSLQEKRYLDAIEYANKVLLLDPKCHDAQILIQEARQEAKRAVDYFIREGKKYYNIRYLDRAKIYFEKALEIDKTNNTALIYHKKIERQLQTIKSLE